MKITGRIDLSRWRDRASIEGEARLEDVSVADAPSKVIARAPVDADGKFEIDVAPRTLSRKGHFIVSAQVRATALDGAVRTLGTVKTYPWRPGAGPLRLDVELWS
jgi:hypothetical protein